MKTGIVVEGGGMRGIYGAGVLDVLLENDIKADGLIGVSAGAIHGCSFVSGQKGRSIRYNLKYSRDPRYMSMRSLIRTGDMFGIDFCYRELPETLDPFDNETFESSSTEYYVTCTDVETGQPVYHRCPSLRGDRIDWVRASASITYLFFTTFCIDIVFVRKPVTYRFFQPISIYSSFYFLQPLVPQAI